MLRRQPRRREAPRHDEQHTCAHDRAKYDERGRTDRQHESGWATDGRRKHDGTQPHGEKQVSNSKLAGIVHNRIVCKSRLCFQQNPRPAKRDRSRRSGVQSVVCPVSVTIEVITGEIGEAVAVNGMDKVSAVKRG